MTPGGWWTYRIVYAIGWRSILAASVVLVVYMTAKGLR